MVVQILSIVLSIWLGHSLIIEEEHLETYNRADWGYWQDADGDCLDTRQEILEEESITPVTIVKEGSKCKVTKGTWYCHYTGEYFTDPSLLDTEHLVPLKEAHESGAFRWTNEERVHFFNDRDKDHLMMVSLSANRSKGSRSPDEWMPPNANYHCTYLRSWVRVKEKYMLSFDQKEIDYIASRTDCAEAP